MTKFSVPDMSCGHCKAAVEAALATVTGVGQVSVDLEARTVSVAGTARVDALCAALATSGYPATVLG